MTSLRPYIVGLLPASTSTITIADSGFIPIHTVWLSGDYSGNGGKWYPDPTGTPVGVFGGGGASGVMPMTPAHLGGDSTGASGGGLGGGCNGDASGGGFGGGCASGRDFGGGCSGDTSGGGFGSGGVSGGGFGGGFSRGAIGGGFGSGDASVGSFGRDRSGSAHSGGTRSGCANSGIKRQVFTPPNTPNTSQGGERAALPSLRYLQRQKRVPYPGTPGRWQRRLHRLW